jgi:Fur family zinc uptake transcriptional regulator
MGFMDKQLFVDQAEQHCALRGCKLTALRRRVLELVLQQQGVIKAYQVLAALQKERGGAAPPTVYRALDFLVEQGLLHRVEALNGFVVCDHLGCQHECLFLVCEHCGSVAEVDAATCLASLNSATSGLGFTLRPQNLVLAGTCQNCIQ